MVVIRISNSDHDDNIDKVTDWQQWSTTQQLCQWHKNDNKEQNRWMTAGMMVMIGIVIVETTNDGEDSENGDHDEWNICENVDMVVMVGCNSGDSDCRKPWR